ncbi:MAG TPA: thioredoxin [Eubacteriales bacterium]|nr:thioredoxin [Eubacteriales bacterium]
MSAVKINQGNYRSEVEESTTPVLIDFWASWCGPCGMLSPVVDELAGELSGKVKVAKVNVDEEPALSEKFGVMSIPTLVLVKDGKVAGKSVGVRSKNDIKRIFDLN